MRIVLNCAVLLFLTGIIHAQETFKNPNGIMSQVIMVYEKLANNEIPETEILQIPPRILTRVRITPETIESQFYYKLIIRDVRGTARTYID